MNIEAIRIKGWDGKDVEVVMTSREHYFGILSGYNSLSVELTEERTSYSKEIKLLDIEKIESILMMVVDE